MKKILTFAVLVFVPLLASASVPICVFDCDNNHVVQVPEPGALSLLLVGLAVLGAIKLRNKIRK